ncbi:MAG TPA: hypothetical protein PLF56_00870 [Micropruina sp.]|jgi:hypothetical protein|nr:hypothetical protein [Micropruina sp.]
MRRPFGDRTLWMLAVVAALALIAAIVFGVAINTQAPLQPLPVPSRASA